MLSVIPELKKKRKKNNSIPTFLLKNVVAVVVDSAYMATTALTLRYRTRRAHKGSSPGEIAARCAQRPRQADHAGDGEGADPGRAQIACVEREQCRDLRAGGVAHQEQAIRVAAILVDVRASPGTGGCSIVHEGRKADLRVFAVVGNDR